nr:DUF4143 domain-containing protein [Chitinophaga sp. XS-30]
MQTQDDLLGHPVVGASWEGFVIENLLSCLPVGVTPWFYRTSAGAEIDLVIEHSPKKKYAIEIKRSLVPTLSKGFHSGCEDVGATERFIVYPGNDSFPAAHNVTVLPISDMMKKLKNSVDFTSLTADNDRYMPCCGKYQGFCGLLSLSPLFFAC